MEITEIASGILLGLGLAAAVGFRIFIPALLTSLGAYFEIGGVQLAESMQWMGSIPAIALFGTATLAEILAYYIPFFDNLLDTIATPAAVGCGSLLMGSTIIELDPMIKWPLAIIAGGGTAGLIKGGTSLLRLKSSAVTAGTANPIVSTGETILSFVISILSFFVPILIILVLLWVFYKLIFKRLWKKQNVS